MDRNIGRSIDLNEEYSRRDLDLNVFDLNEEYRMRDLDLNVEFNRRVLDLNVDFNRRDLDLNADYESDQNLPTGSWLHLCEDHQEAIIPDHFEVQASNNSNISDPSQRATYNSLNISAPYAGPANSQPEHFQAGFGDTTRGPVSGTQHLSDEARQVRIQRMIQLQMAAYSQASVLHSVHSAGYMMASTNNSNITDPSQRATYNSLNMSAPYVGPVDIQPEHFQAGFVHATGGPLSGTQHLPDEVIQVGIQRMIQLQMAAYSQASVLHSVHSAGYVINSQVHRQSPLSFEHDQLAFSNLAEYPVGEIVSGQPFVHVPIFHETPQGSLWSNITSLGSFPASFWPAYAGTGMENLGHFAANISSIIGVDNWEGMLFNAEDVLSEAPAARAMQDQTDDLSLGMSEENILMHLRREKFLSITGGTSGSDEFCCICQEIYGSGDDLGKIDCRHKYHFDCIKEWLALRNTCPICKCKALAAGP